MKVLSDEAFRRVSAVTRRVERMPTERGGERSATYDSAPGFWAMLMGADVSGLRYSFNKVIPDPKSTYPEAFTISNTLRFGFDGPPVYDAAFEVNEHRGIAPGTIVWLHFGGYADSGNPVFFFAHQNIDPRVVLPPHDHRDNANGGFAFAVFHPGTTIPQMDFKL